MGWSVKNKSRKTPGQRFPINTENQSDVAWEATHKRQRGRWGERNVKAEDSNSSHPTLKKQELYTGWQLPRRWSMHAYAKRFYPRPMSQDLFLKIGLLGFLLMLCSGIFPAGMGGSGTFCFKFSFPCNKNIPLSCENAAAAVTPQYTWMTRTQT